MRLTIPGSDFSKKENRDVFLQFMSITVEGKADTDFKPYAPNSDEYHWVIDRMNNWRLTFCDVNPRAIFITYRYQSQATDAEGALLKWLEFRVRAVKTINQGR